MDSQGNEVVTGIHRLQSYLLKDPFVAELQSVLRGPIGKRFAPVGARSKPALIPNSVQGNQSIEPLEIRGFQGVVSYDPAEFLITARAGTQIGELKSVLSEKGQYLPFDPLFSGDGATLGGTLASGISGPDRLLYGGMRDFIMEIAMLDGLGNCVRGGGKVVKNAAGFDTPKMMVGSYGRMGVILEATLKVFPAPQASYGMAFDCASFSDAIGLSQSILAKPWPVAALDITHENRLEVRLAGPESSLQAVAESIEVLAGRAAIGSPGHDQQQQRRKELNDWFSTNNSQEALVRVALHTTQAARFSQELWAQGIEDFLFCAGGCTAWIKLPLASLETLNQSMQRQSLSGVVVRGNSDRFSLGDHEWLRMSARIQKAIDPDGKFVTW